MKLLQELQNDDDDDDDDINFNDSTSSYRLNDFAKCLPTKSNIIELSSNISHYDDDENKSSFTWFFQGLEVFAYQEQDIFSLNEQVLDTIRKRCEECDYVEGFQCFIDSDTGFLGIGHDILQHLQDEYSKKVVFTVANMTNKIFSLILI